MHWVESYRTNCQTEESMWNWTTNEADGDYRRMAYPKVVFSPLSFSTSTNDQPIHDGTRSFIYADNLCITAQYPTFTKVKDTIEEALSDLTQFYRNNSPRANPDKTQVMAFHLQNREVKRSLKIAWNGVDLVNTAYKYIDVTLDRTLNYKQHIWTRRWRWQPATTCLRNWQIQNGEQMQ